MIPNGPKAPIKQQSYTATICFRIYSISLYMYICNSFTLTVDGRHKNRFHQKSEKSEKLTKFGCPIFDQHCSAEDYWTDVRTTAQFRLKTSIAKDTTLHSDRCPWTLLSKLPPGGPIAPHQVHVQRARRHTQRTHASRTAHAHTCGPAAST